MKPLSDQQIREVYSNGGYTLKRADAGMRMVNTNERYRDHTNTLADVICDLLHHSARESINFEAALEAAKRTWERDTGLTY